MIEENRLANIAVNCCFKIHKALGPGLLESVYEEVLCFELQRLGVKFQRQVALPVFYEAVRLEIGFRADVIIQDKLIIEVKSVESILPVHQKQLLTYLRLTNMKLGLLVNFNAGLIKDGIHRVVNGL